MCQATQEELLVEFGVAGGDVSWEGLCVAMRRRGVQESVIESLVEGQASELMSVVCETYCDELIQCLRQQRFGGGFAAAMRVDPSQFGGSLDQAGLDQMISAMLPHFDAQNLESSHARHALVADLGRVLASLQWGLIESPDCAQQDAHEQASLVIASMLDFLPKPTHQEILAVVERCLVKAQLQGCDAVFGEQGIEDEEEPALAKSI